jgi:hypothetical protein
MPTGGTDVKVIFLSQGFVFLLVYCTNLMRQCNSSFVVLVIFQMFSIIFPLFLSPGT